DLGDLARARAALAHCQELYSSASNAKSGLTVALNLAYVEFSAGHFPKALEHSEKAINRIGGTEEGRPDWAPLAYRAASNFMIGDLSDAMDDLQRANEAVGGRLYGLAGTHEAEFKLFQGRRVEAASQTRSNRELSADNGWSDDLCRSDSLLA